MKCELKCLACHIEQIEKIGGLLNISDQTKEMITRSVLKKLATVDFNQTNPQIMLETWKIITDVVDEPNPYQSVKHDYNQKLMKMYDDFKATIRQSKKSFLKALEIASLGNIIDFGAKHDFNQSMLFDTLNLWESQISPFIIDHHHLLYEQLSKADTLLYIGDNCGEIVLDKLFIEEMTNQFPQLNIVFSVRGKPVLNDVTIEDAQEVNMMEFATVIDDGNGAPGTVLDQVSDEFKKVFHEADVVIAKGQGNFESLFGANKQVLFFLFMAKCSVVANLLNVPRMKCICMQNETNKFN